MESDRAGAGTTFAVLILGGALTLAGKVLADSQETSTAALGLTALVGLAVTAFGALVLAWWGLSFCLAIAAELLMQHGRLSAAQRIGAFAPMFMRRAACLTLGMNLVVAPSAHADPAFTALPFAAEQIHAAEEASALSPQWTPVEAPQVLAPSWQPTALPPGGSLLVKESRESRSDLYSAQDEVIVQPGDSLWTISARHLGPEASNANVAEAWPRWYAANRGVIGENPELLQPGQILHAPTAKLSESK